MKIYINTSKQENDLNQGFPNSLHPRTPSNTLHIQCSLIFPHLNYVNTNSNRFK
jgi:hypothetical protein